MSNSLQSWVHEHIAREAIADTISVRGDGWCGWRALAAQHYHNQDRYLEVKEEMLLVAKVNADVYMKYLCGSCEAEYEKVIKALEYGITSETKHMRTKFCPSRFWFDANTMAQIAADALGIPIATYATETENWHNPLLHLPLSPPLPGIKPQPYVLHLVGNHYHSLKMRPAIKVTWPPVPSFHEKAWHTMNVPADWKTSWRHIHRNSTIIKKFFIEID